MDDTRLRALLARLHEELRSADTGDPGTRAVVDKLGAQIGPIVTAPAGKPPAGGYSGLAGRLREAAVHFESSHPDLARSIEGIVDSLGSYGI
jgi:hypothetical protein